MWKVVFCALLAVCSAADTVDNQVASWIVGIFANVTDAPPTTSRVVLDPAVTNDEVPCMTEKNEEGVCTIYYLCDLESRTINNDGTTLIDIREKNACPHYLEVCCLERKKKKVSEVLGGAENEGTTLRPAGSGAGPQTTVQAMPTPAPAPLPAAKASCGWSGVSMLEPVFGAVAKSDDRVYAEFGEFPWMVAVLIKNPATSVWNADDFRGGGALVRPSVVLTVAHIVDTVKEPLKCRAGELDTQTIREQLPHQERDVTERLIHPKYKREPSVLNNFALLFLASPFELQGAPHIGVACLARALPPPGAACFGMGWGKNDSESTHYAVTLKKIRQKLVGPEECAAELRESYGPFYRVHKSYTCAVGANGADTCRGDGGSPLACPIETTSTGLQRFVVAGLVGYGVSCGLEALPALYANVARAHAWVDGAVAARGLGTLEIV